jgi:hypothetical protein
MVPTARLSLFRRSWSDSHRKKSHGVLSRNRDGHRWRGHLHLQHVQSVSAEGRDKANLSHCYGNVRQLRRVGTEPVVLWRSSHLECCSGYGRNWTIALVWAVWRWMCNIERWWMHIKCGQLGFRLSHVMFVHGKKYEIYTYLKHHNCFMNTLYYVTENYWCSGLCPLSTILENRRHNVSETRSVSEEWCLLRCYAVWLL